ncbi:MAG: hypothetical protein BWY59_00223 [Verrucomicrobia bacterium ADurb.Bin345]|nr:MAG: hypothetical protein BWY59_00223 [Verrucomicrobia bacterium ADurb.Bin345]
MRRKLLCVAVTLVAVMAVVTAQGNLLLNEGFESALSAADWSTTWGAGQFTRQTWNTPPEGSYAIYFYGGWSGGDTWGGGLQAVNAGIAPGIEYDLSAEFYWDNGWSAASQMIKLEFFDSGANLLAAYTNTLSGLTEATWVTQSVSGTAPAGSTYAQVVFEGSGFGAGGVLAADNFSLVAIPEPSVAFLALLGGGALMLLRRKVT